MGGQTGGSGESAYEEALELEEAAFAEEQAEKELKS